MNESIRKTRLRVLEKLIALGYNNDKKLSSLKLEDLLMNQSFTRSDLEVAMGIKNAHSNKSLITYLSNTEERKMNYEERKQ